ncbi:MAG TPA: radical SAM protein [Firmicutes bacterium]|nr:radical SAM protein [Candidatus Fermentithermobacillaceae bacterium]
MFSRDALEKITRQVDAVLCEELERAFEVKMENRSALLVAVSPTRTVPVTVTGRRCSLGCAHCGGRYLEKMIPCDEVRDAIQKRGATSILLSGGCDPDGKVPVLENLDGLKSILPGVKVNIHPGLVEEERAAQIAQVAQVISFDFIQDEIAIKMAFGRRFSARDYLESYRYLRKYAGDRLVPHILVGIRGGELGREYETVEMLAGEGLSSLAFIVFIPTPGTRWAGLTPPSVTDVAKLIAWTRQKLPHVTLSLGCMRPGGRYRRELDQLAVLAGVDKIVFPSREAVHQAEVLGLDVLEQEECCAFPWASGESGTRPERGRVAPETSRGAPIRDRVRPDEGGENRAGCPGFNASKRRGDSEGLFRDLQVGVSLGTAVVLGLSRAKTSCLPTTGYLSIGERCVRDCSFCPRARSSTARGDLISRVTWPSFPWKEVLSRLSSSESARHLSRICLQLVESPETMPACLEVLKEIRSSCTFLKGIPVSVSASPYSAARVSSLLEAGASRVGLPLDAVNPQVYARIKGGDLQKAWEVLTDAAKLFPGRVSTHFIAGLGETEEEMVEAMARALGAGVTVALFSFTPVQGTGLEKKKPPPVSTYRRLQIALCLLKQGLRVEDFRFSEGRIAEIRCGDRIEKIEAELLNGKAFQTTGCPGCNRPYYNERPGGVMMNYPWEMSALEARECISSSGLVRRRTSLVLEVDAGEDEALEDRSV